MIRLRLTERAEEDLSDVFAWIAGGNEEAAMRFLEFTSRSFTLLLQHPQIGRPRKFQCHSGLRSWRVRGFKNYLIFYLLEKNALTVVRVLHGARDLEKELFQGITSIAALLEESN